MSKDEGIIHLYKFGLRTSLDNIRKDIEGNFEITEDGGIDTPDTETGHEHALKFAEWTGYNQALDDVKQIMGFASAVAEERPPKKGKR